MAACRLFNCQYQAETRGTGHLALPEFKPETQVGAYVKGPQMGIYGGIYNI